jgi:hypothetical protein
MSERLRILILAANPVNTPRLKLETEHRLLRNRMRDNVEAGTCEILAEWAARLNDVQDALKTYRPHIVHFAGHADDGGICLEGDEGECRPVSRGELSLLLNSSKDQLRLVTLNACSSVAQVEKIGQLVDYILGTASPVEDDAAVRFTAHFYEAVATGSTVREAFHKAQGKLAAGGDKSQADGYRLLVRPGVDETKPLLPPFDKDKLRTKMDALNAESLDVANTFVDRGGTDVPPDEQSHGQHNEHEIDIRRAKVGRARFGNRIITK